MSYNGSGTFLINTAGQPVVSGTVISSTAFNALTADLATGLSTAITKDGQTTITANIPMANYKFTGLGVGSAAGDSANLSQVQSTAVKLLASVSGADTITAVGSPNVAAYVAGQMFYFVAAAANTGAVTINIDSLGAKSITRDGTTALAAGDIQSGEVCVIVYDGTQFQLVNGASQSASIVTENLTVNKATVLNESGGDNDTRIEGDTDANLLFVDASTDRVGVGTNAPATKFDVNGTVTGTQFNINSASYDDRQLGVDSTGFFIYNATDARYDLSISDSGNLGLGTTGYGDYASGDKSISIGVGSNIRGQSSGTDPYTTIYTNAFFNSNNVLQYIVSDFASGYEQYNGTHAWYTAPSGTAGNAVTSFTQAMTLDASGNLGVGDTSPSSYGKMVVVNTSAGAETQGLYLVNGSTTANTAISLSLMPSNATTRVGRITAVQDGAQNIALTFSTSAAASPVERARITSGGFFKASNDGTYLNATGNYHEFRTNVNDTGVINVTSNSANGTQYGIGITTANDQNDTTRYFLNCTGGATERATIRSNGGLANYSANNVNLASDERLKKDISPLDSAWGKVKDMEVVNFRYKDCNEGDPLLYGVIAQQVQPIVPELVVVTQEAKEAVAAKDAVLDEEGNVIEPAVEAKEATPEYYGIREQPMYWLAIKALQEAMTRIEELEAKVAALEAK